MNRAAKTPAGFFHFVEIEALITFSDKYDFPVVPALHDVLRLAGQGETWQSSHSLPLSSPCLRPPSKLIPNIQSSLTPSIQPLRSNKDQDFRSLPGENFRIRLLHSHLADDAGIVVAVASPRTRRA
jgi:hypothetical protein